VIGEDIITKFVDVKNAENINHLKRCKRRKQMTKEELISELRKLSEDIRDSGREKTKENDKKLERVTQIIDTLMEILPDDEFYLLMTEINNPKVKEEEREM
jgi:maltooligosyltrehalose synthase